MRTRTVLSGLLLLGTAAAGCSGGNVFTLEPGTCYDDPGGEVNITDVSIVDCEEAHDNEVFATFDLPDGDYPGLDRIQSEAGDGCLDRFDDYVGTAVAESRFRTSFLRPTPESWDGGDREIVCVLADGDGEPLTGSVQGSGQ